MLDNYYKRMIYPFVVNLVESFIDLKGYDEKINISDLSDDSVSNFAALLLTQDPSVMGDIVWSDDVYKLAIAALKTQDDEEKIIWSEKVMVNIINFFSEKMQSILEEVHSEMVTNFYEAAGKTFIVDQQNGEGRWI